MGSGPIRRGVTGGTRWVGRAAVVLGLSCIAIGVIAPPAGANYGRIAAEARCDRTVTWTASASTEGNDDERINEKVAVEYRPAGSQDSWTMIEPGGSFDRADAFTFDGSFPLPAGVDEVEVRVSPQVRWGADRDGAEPGSPRYTTAAVPDGCAEDPLVATLTPDCDGGGVSVVAQNLGTAPTTVSVSVDQILVRDVPLAAGATASVIVPVLEGTSVAVRVTSGSFVVAQRELRPDCSIPGPAASITERCGIRQAVVLARSGATATRPVEITVDDAVVHRAEVRADEVLQRTIELPATGAVDIVVSVGGTTVSRGTIGGCTGLVTGAVSCGSGGRPSCNASAAPPTTVVEAPPPPPPPLVIELTDGTLAVTGPWQRTMALLAGGALLAAGGAALVLEQRRRPRPSQLAAVVAPYRQRWWVDLSDD